MESSSDLIMWGYWGFGSGVIVDGQTEGGAMDVELVDQDSM